MIRFMKKIVLPLFILIFLFSSFFGCSSNININTDTTASSAGTDSSCKAEQVENLNLTGFPIVNTPITLRSFGGKHANQGDWTKMLVVNEYEKMTGIKIIWDLVPQENINERKNSFIGKRGYS